MALASYAYPIYCIDSGHRFAFVCYDCGKMKNQKTYDYQNIPIINLIRWQVYDMARYVVSIIML